MILNARGNSFVEKCCQTGSWFKSEFDPVLIVQHADRLADAQYTTLQTHVKGINPATLTVYIHTFFKHVSVVT